MSIIIIVAKVTAVAVLALLAVGTLIELFFTWLAAGDTDAEQDAGSDK